MSQNQQPRQSNDKWIEITLVFIGVLFAWPALVLAGFTRLLIKYYADDPIWYWIGAGVLGTFGAWMLVTHINLSVSLAVMVHDAILLLFHFNLITGKQLVLDSFQVWVGSLFIFPWITLLIELFAPKSLKQSLLAQERHRQATQQRKSERAAKRVAQAPDQIDGSAVLGALIDNPNM